MTDVAATDPALIAQTAEASQELKPRSEVTAQELLREVGAVLRMSERSEPSTMTERPPGSRASMAWGGAAPGGAA